jgi:glycosyltransferase involved in cell wall biosynthesis
MRVVFIARYLQRVNHRKVMALAAQPGIELWHIAPRKWVDNFRAYEQELAQGEGYQLRLANPFPVRNDIHRFVYWPPTLWLNTIRPDIVHIEEEPDSLAALQAVWARRMWASTARLVLFTWQNVRRARSYPVERLARFVLRHVDHAIAGNRQAIEVLRQQGYPGPVTVLPQLGVDTDTFKPLDAAALRKELGLGEFVVGYVGRFAPEKGLDILVQAAAQVENCHVLLVGRGPMQADIEALARTHGLRDRLTIVSAVPHHEVPLYLNAMDVLVLPSRTMPQWKEQFGHVLIEAMACGTPVIGSDSGAIPEVINQAGLIVPEGNVAALVAHFQRLAHSPDERLRLRACGLERVKEHYTHEQIAQQTVQVYQATLMGQRIQRS